MGMDHGGPLESEKDAWLFPGNPIEAKLWPAAEKARLYSSLA